MTLNQVSLKRRAMSRFKQGGISDTLSWIFALLNFVHIGPAGVLLHGKNTMVYILIFKEDLRCGSKQSSCHLTTLQCVYFDNQKLCSVLCF